MGPVGATDEADAVPDAAKLYYSGRLSCQTRHAEGLAALVGPWTLVALDGRPVEAVGIAKLLHDSYDARVLVPTDNERHERREKPSP